MGCKNHIKALVSEGGNLTWLVEPSGMVDLDCGAVRCWLQPPRLQPLSHGEHPAVISELPFMSEPNLGSLLLQRSLGFIMIYFE